MTWGQFAWGEKPWAGPDAASVLAGIVPLYFSDCGFTSAVADAPAKAYFDARVDQFVFSRSLADSLPFGGLATSSGELDLNNGDGALDSIVNSSAIDGRRIAGRLGSKNSDGSFWAYSQFGTIFDGTAASWDETESAVRINLRDNLYKFAVPIQPVKYAGSGGLEGGADLAGKPKPLAFGTCPNVPLVQLDSANLVYQFHGAAGASGVAAVYDRGAALAFDADYASYAALLAAVIPAGKYGTCLVLGLIRLGGAPAGTVTADVQGVSATAADILKSIAKNNAGFIDDQLDLNSFVDLNINQGAPVGFWTGTDVLSAGDVVDQVLRGISGFGGCTRKGRFKIGLFGAGTGAPSFSYGAAEILSIQRQQVAPIWRVSVGYGRNFTVQTDIAGSVPAVRRDFIDQDIRLVPASNGAAATAHLLALDMPATPAIFATQADAATDATRLKGVYCVDRVLYTVTIAHQGFRNDLGDSGILAYPRFGLDAGKYARIVSARDDISAGVVEFRMFV